jgi:hypothetical protein
LGEYTYRGRAYLTYTHSGGALTLYSEYTGGEVTLTLAPAAVSGLALSSEEALGGTTPPVDVVISLSWDAPSSALGLDGYKIIINDRRTIDIAHDAPTESAGTLSYNHNFNGVRPGPRVIQVVAYADLGDADSGQNDFADDINAPRSESVTLRIFSQNRPPAPLNFVANANPTGDVLLMWRVVSNFGPDKYRIWRSKDGGRYQRLRFIQNGASQIRCGTNCLVTDTPEEPGRYSYILRAFDKNEESPDSTVEVTIND